MNRGFGPSRIAAIVVGVVLVSLIGLLAVGGGNVDDGPSLLGERAPELAGPTIDGGTYNIDDQRGQWVLVNFFATWCPPCVREHPDLVELEAWGAERGDLGLVAAVFNDPVDNVTQFFQERGGSWPVVNEPSIPIAYQVSQVPESFLVAPTGQIVLHVEGQLNADEVKQIIEEAS